MSDQLVLCTEAEAREITDRIRSSVDEVWRSLGEAHERKAYKALGYGTFQEYCETELGMTARNARYLLDQAMANREIEAAAGMGNALPISGRAAKDIKPQLPEVVDEIRERIEAGEDPEETVRETVAKARTNGNGGRRWSKNQGRPDLIVAKVVANLSVLAESIQSIDVGEYVATDEEIRALDRVIERLRKFRSSLKG